MAATLRGRRGGGEKSWRPYYCARVCVCVCVCVRCSAKSLPISASLVSSLGPFSLLSPPISAIFIIINATYLYNIHKKPVDPTRNRAPQKCDIFPPRNLLRNLVTFLLL